MSIVSNQRYRILIVDDEAINIQVLYQILKQDYSVFMASNGQQAIEFCNNQLPDLILLDIVMPNLDGYEVCRRLKKNQLTQNIPVIFITAQHSVDAETKGLEAGAVDFISKPISPAIVKARVKTHLTLKRQTDLLRELAFIDGLTGVANRRFFDEALQTEWRQCRRQQTPLALVMIDIDYFKYYNDHHGHQAGDECLRAVAHALKEQMMRPHDLIARYGGEEFACLLPDTDVLGAWHKAEQLRAAVEQLAIPHPVGEQAFLSLSCGAAALIPHSFNSPQELISSADAMLYSAKHAGRNRSCAATIGSHS